MADEPDMPEDRLQTEAEELMRQKRYQDAARRYQDLRRVSPTDLWAFLGQVSALECAGDVEAAERLLEEAALRHRASAPLHRFRRAFFERREDLRQAAGSAKALQEGLFDEGPADQLADLYFNQARYHEAQSEFERLLAQDLDDGLRAGVLARLGACLRQIGEAEPAHQRLSEALRMEPDQPWAVAELAEADRALGRVEAARAGYRRALDLNPGDQWTRGHLAQLEHEQGDHDTAVGLYDDILTAQPKAHWAMVELAQVLSARDGDGDRARAASLCRSALDVDGDYPWAHAHLGQLARRDGDLAAARDHLQRAVDASNGAGWVLHELADVCRQLGRHEEALAHLARARAAEPYDAAGYGYTADVLRHQGRGEEAVPWLDKAVELDPTYAWAWRELAELHALAGRHDRAGEAYAKAVECDPDAAVNDGLRAFLLRLQNRRDEAVPWLERALGMDPDYQWAWRELADDHLACGRPEQALAACDKGIERFPRSAHLNAARAEALRRLGRRDEARAAIAKALELDPKAAQAWAIRAELAAEGGDFAAALAAAEQAARQDASPEYQCLRAQVLIALGRARDARAVLDPLLALAQPPAVAWELAIAAAERDGDDRAARALLDRAAAQGGQDPRILVRRARTGDAAALDALAAADSAPWRDAAQVLAQHGRIAPARRAAFRQLEDLVRLGPVEAARGWVEVAELELGQGESDAARAAAEEAVRLDPASLPGHLLLAILADQREDGDAAARHLARVADLAGSQDPTVIRQLAALHEKGGRLDEAAGWWDRLAAVEGDEAPRRRAEALAFRLRHGRDDGAGAAECIAALPADSGERRRLLRDAAVARARAGEPAAGADLVLRLGAAQPADHLLIAQLRLAADDHPAALVHAQQAEASEDADLRRIALLIRARALAPGDPLAAAALVADRPDDEEAACIRAEALCLAGDAEGAHAAVEADGLPTVPSPERLQLRAVLALERHGLLACAQVLARAGTPPDTPMVRLIAAALGEDTPTADPSTVGVLPPLPAMARRLAEGWLQHRRADLAAAFLSLVAGRLGDRRLHALAAEAHLRLGDWQAAARHARAARDPWRWLRASFGPLI
jgi:tetratricopeptide (TPR) repeat protein